MNEPYFKINLLPVFYLQYMNKLGWFRIFGRGLKWKDTTVHMLLFSERSGHTKGISIGKWYISVLKKSK